MSNLILFIVLQLLNVILSTIRSIATVKADKRKASWIAAISFTFYNAVVKLIVEQDIWVIIAVTLITNLVGTYIAKAIVEYIQTKRHKDKLWVYMAVVEGTKDTMKMLKSVFTENGIVCLYSEIKTGTYSLNIYSHSQDDSRMITSTLKNAGIPYCALETVEKG